jgi:putative FmdB family regulatory protein
MPSYDYRCRQCGTTFEVRRSMTVIDTTATCPDGHADTVKLLSTVAIGGLTTVGARSAGTAPGARASTAPAAGGCCGGDCCG